VGDGPEYVPAANPGGTRTLIVGFQVAELLPVIAVAVSTSWTTDKSVASVPV